MGDVMNAVIEQRWPAHPQADAESFAALRDRMQTYLQQHGVSVTAHSHFGFVVENVRDELKALAEQVAPPWADAKVEWGEAFGCEISRRVQDGVEYEFIEPQRDSFLQRHLRDVGAGLQHLSFNVADLDTALQRLRTAGVDMADPDVHAGLHGRIAFVRPEPFAPLCIELCEPAH